MKLNLPTGSRRGFSLLEVMIAIGIFFLATFAILSLVSSSLANARRLQRPSVEASALLSQLSLTNKLTEGTYSGNLAELLGKSYQDYRWAGETAEVESNRLYTADFVIRKASGNHEIASETITFFYRPQTDTGSLDGGIGIK